METNSIYWSLTFFHILNSRIFSASSWPTDNVVRGRHSYYYDIVKPGPITLLATDHQSVVLNQQELKYFSPEISGNMLVHSQEYPTGQGTMWPKYLSECTRFSTKTKNDFLSYKILWSSKWITSSLLTYMMDDFWSSFDMRDYNMRLRVRTWISYDVIDQSHDKVQLQEKVGRGL